MDALVVALFVVSVAWVGFRRRSEGSAGESSPWLPVLAGVAVGILVAVLAAAQLAKDDLAATEQLWSLVGGYLLAGVAVSFAVAQLSGRDADSLGVFGVGLLAGGTLLSATSLLGIELTPPSIVAFATGASLVLFLRNHGGYVGALAVAVVPLVSLFAASREATDLTSWVCLLLGSAVLLSMVLQPRLTAQKSQLSSGWVAVGLALVALAAMAAFRPELRSLSLVMALGAVGGIVAALGLRTADALEATIASLIAVGVATAAFALLGGLGIASSTAAMALALLACGSPTSWAALTPLAGLLGYRVIREFTQVTARSPDLGVQYAVTGMLLGAAVVTLAALAQGRNSSVPWRGVSVAMWTILLLGLASVIRVILGVEALIGVVMGGCVAGWSLARHVKLAAFAPGAALSLGLGAAVLAPYFAPFQAISREFKILTLIYAAVFLVVLGVIVLRSKESEPSE